MNHDVCDRNLLISEPVVKGWQIRCHRFGHIAVLHRNLGAEHVPRDRGPNINAAELLALHPYEVPEFVVIEPREVAEPYRAWLLDATASPPPEATRSRK